MKRRILKLLQTAWVVAALVILLMGTTLCASTDEACFQAGGSMLLLMFWLSFPCGLVFAAGALIWLGNETIHFPSDFITAWLIMACGGLLQWFVVVPRLIERQRFTLLNLETRAAPELSRDNEEAAAIGFQPMTHERATKLEPVCLTKTASRRARIGRKSTKRLTAFDRKGRTPLERVIDHS